MPDTPPPALSDVALRETLDLLGQVVASMSARLDKQSEQIEALAKAVEKARAAAKRTEQQTDPAAYARFIGAEVENALDKVLDEVENALDKVLDEFAGAVLTIRKDHETTAARLKELEQAEEAALARLRQDLDTAARWRRRVPWVWAGALSVALVLAVVLESLV